MQLALTPDEAAFRDELRTFYTTKIPAEFREKTRLGLPLGRDDFSTSHKILNDHGLAVPNWPVEWGGKDWTPAQHQIWLDEMQLASVPEPLNFNAKMVGPVIAEFGSQEIKQRFLPPTASIDIWWCQGFSEPEAGSDLASLRTTALRDGDSYVVNGQKLWTTAAHVADHLLVVARTEARGAAKHNGLSMISVPTDAAGLTIRPIATMGGSEVNEIFFTDVRVPADRLLGVEGNGWKQLMAGLNHERLLVAAQGLGRAQRAFDDAVAYVKERKQFGRTIGSFQTIRHRIANLATDIESLRYLVYGIAQLVDANPEATFPREASMAKLQAAELAKRTALEAMQMMGGAGYAVEYGMEFQVRQALSLTIGGGVAEVQRDIIAKTYGL